MLDVSYMNQREEDEVILQGLDFITILHFLSCGENARRPRKI